MTFVRIHLILGRLVYTQHCQVLRRERAIRRLVCPIDGVGARNPYCTSAFTFVRPHIEKSSVLENLPFLKSHTTTSEKREKKTEGEGAPHTITSITIRMVAKKEETLLFVSFELMSKHRLRAIASLLPHYYSK